MDVGGFGVGKGVGVFGLSGLGVNVAVGAEVAEGVGVGDSACVAFVAVAAGRGVSVLTTEGVSEGAAVAELTSKGLPQVVQNFTPGALAAPQPEQAESAGSGVSECPQLTQNLVQLSLGVRQLEHKFCPLAGVS